MDASKLQQATQIIATQISKIAANTPMDYGTVGATLGNTKRQGEAYNMSLYIVSKLVGIKFTGSLYENKSREEKDALKVVDQIAAAAIAITGK